MNIFFLTVKDTENKLKKICLTVKEHFNRRERILITAPDDASAKYIDQLLWRLPQESFIPHVLSYQPVNEAVVVTTTLHNLNEASILINLCPSCSPILHLFQTTYELFDHTTPGKAALSQQRYDTYLNAGYSVKVAN